MGNADYEVWRVEISDLISLEATEKSSKKLRLYFAHPKSIRMNFLNLLNSSYALNN